MTETTFEVRDQRYFSDNLTERGIASILPVWQSGDGHPKLHCKLKTEEEVNIYIEEEDFWDMLGVLRRDWFYGTISYPDGRSYKGTMNGSFLPHGAGHMTYPDGTEKKGRWRVGEYLDNI